MVVEDLDLRIMGIGYTKGITLLDKGFRRLGKGRVRVFDEARRNRVFGGSLEDFTENGFTLGAGGGIRSIFKKGFSFKDKSIPVCFAEVMEGFDRTGGSGDFREGEENGEMIGTEGCEGVPGEIKG